MSPYTIAELFRPDPFPSRLTPHYIRYALLLNGADFPRRGKDEPVRYLRLGPHRQEWEMIHAAALPEWDFWAVKAPSPATAENPENTWDSLPNLYILDDDIQALAEKGFSGELPDFDIIAVDHLWSSASPATRQDMLTIINNHLKPGGIICIGYHAMPGCVSLVPLRDLMLQQLSEGSPPETRQLQALQALNFADLYAETDAGVFADMPSAKHYLESIKQTSFGQLEKDWLNPHWKPFYFAGMAAHMESTRCRYAGSLDLPSQLDMCLPPGVIPLLRQEEDAVLRETLRDFGLNRQTRLDLFTRGTYLPPDGEMEQSMQHLPFCLASPLHAITPVSLPSPGGELVFDDEIYSLFLSALSSDGYRPKTIRTLSDHALLRELDPTLFPAILNILVAAGLVFPARQPLETAAQKNCDRLNRMLCEASRDSRAAHALASPVLGTGVPLSRIEQFILLARADGRTGIAACAQSVMTMLSARNETLLDRDGNALDAEAALKILEQETRWFVDNVLPFLDAVKVGLDNGLQTEKGLK